MVALISGYFDDSQSTGAVWVLAGYVGYRNQWDYFEELWGGALDKHRVPYFHMREMAEPNGTFAKWIPPEDHQGEVIAFFKDLVGALGKCGLRSFTSAVWIDDVNRFNREKGVGLEPYPLAAYACMSNVALHYVDLPVTMTFDRVEKIDSKLAVARSYADSDKHLAPGLCDRIVTTPLPKGVTSREVRPMQAADLIAWEYRNAFFKMRPWQLLADRPTDDREAMWQHYLQWTREATGRDPVLRKSLDALIAKMPSKGAVWDYHQICTTHEAKLGIWSKPAS